MRTLTRCPGCHTVFVVQRDQLEAREGRVRCGACGTVFDARMSLEVLEGTEGEPRTVILPPPDPTVSAPAPATAPAPAAPAPRSSEPASASAAATEPTAKHRGDELFDETHPIVLDMGPLPPDGGVAGSRAEGSAAPDDEATLVLPGTKRDPGAADEAPLDKEPLFAEDQGDGTAVPGDAEPASGDADAARSPLSGGTATGEGTEAATPITLGPDGLIESPGAKAQDDAAADPRRPASAVVFRSADAGAGVPDFAVERRERARLARTWALACVPVALLLAIQTALHWRAELGALAPGTRGLLSVLCAPFGCEVGLPQHAELLALEGTNLEAEPAGTLTLYSTLRNRARYEQALPAIELTLTDPRDQPVARRLLAPRDYAPGRSDGIPPGGEVPIRVAIDASATKAAGFRAEAVYP